jgi:PKD repeat protein
MKNIINLSALVFLPALLIAVLIPVSADAAYPAIPIEITGKDGASCYGAADLNDWVGSWEPPQALYDRGQYQDSPDYWYCTSSAEGSTWYEGGAGYGVLVIDLRQNRTLNTFRVFQMFSDGKTTHIEILKNTAYTGSTAPLHSDAGWASVTGGKIEVSAGANNSTYISSPTVVDTSAFSSRYLKLHVWNDGRYGNSSYIELKGIKGYYYNGSSYSINYLRGGPTSGPTASFGPSAASPTVGDSVSFTDSSVDSDGSVVSWNWGFGDGTTSTSQNPTHMYSNKGSYTVSLTVTDNEGLTDTETTSIPVFGVSQTISDFLSVDGATFVTTDTASLSATASSGLDVTFSVQSGPGTISDGTNLSFSSTGTVVVTASQSGNSIYQSAQMVTNTYTVTATPSSGGDFAVRSSRQSGDGVTLDLEVRVGKTYRVYRRDGSLAAARQVHSTNVATSSSMSIDDTNVVNEARVRFYDVVEDDGGVLSTNPTTYAAYVTPTSTGQWYRLSMPISLGASNRLDSTLGDMLRSGAAGDSLAGDLLYVMTPTGSWRTFALADDNTWRVGTPTGAAATNALASGQAYWMKRRSSGSDTNAVYTGPVITEGAPITFGSNTWQLIAWPFATPRREDAGTDKGWGFAAVGAQKGTSWMTADNIWVDGKLLWLHADGRWRKSNGSSAADMQLEAMNGYYYLHRSSGFTWTPEE